VKTYLKPTDEAAFDGMERKQPEPCSQMLGAYSKPRVDSVPVVECAKCKGRGGWNLELNAYGPGKHFRASCNNCNGWGYVRAEQGDHIHEWDRGEHISRCCTRYTCVGCGKVSDVDSSD
jgi:DnaJ-class molecular chaperone